jgi:hypothetical protein
MGVIVTLGNAALILEHHPHLQKPRVCQEGQTQVFASSPIKGEESPLPQGCFYVQRDKEEECVDTYARWEKGSWKEMNHSGKQKGRWLPTALSV